MEKSSYSIDEWRERTHKVKESVDIFIYSEEELAALEAAVSESLPENISIRSLKEIKGTIVVTICYEKSSSKTIVTRTFQITDDIAQKIHDNLVLNPA